MKRRNFLIGAGAASIGGSALIGTQAFSDIESHRSITVQVAEDPNAYLGMKPLDTPNGRNYVGLDDQGHLEIDIGEHDDFEGDPDGASPGEGVNSDSFTWLDGLFELCNQGKEGACVSYALPEGVVANDVDEQTVSFYYVERDSDGAVTNRRMVGEGEEILLELGECAEIGVRTVTKGISADDTPLVDGEVALTADVDGDCFGEPTPGPECPECSFTLGSTDDSFSNLLSAGPDPDAGFPEIDVRLRVDTPLGNGGDLTESNFAVCENGCGQTIESVAFESGGAVDIVVVFDDTGSMFGPIDDLQDEVTGFTDDLEDEGVDARYALVSFKDNAEVDTDFTDAANFKTAVDGLSASGGDDASEDNVDALAVGTGNAQAQTTDTEDPPTGGQLSAFRPGAQRVLIDITDVGAHDETDDRTRFSQSDVEGFLNDGNFAYYAVAPDATGFDVNKKDIADNVDDGEWIEFDFDADLSPVIDDITEDLTADAYVLSYTTTNPTTDGTTRAVDVEIDDPDEGVLYEQGSYSAPGS